MKKNIILIIVLVLTMNLTGCISNKPSSVEENSFIEKSSRGISDDNITKNNGKNIKPEISGEVICFDKIKGFESNLGSLRLVGEINGKAVMADSAELLLVNLDNFSVEKKLNLKHDFYYSNVKQSNDKLIVCLKEEIMVISSSLNEIQSIPLPRKIKEKSQNSEGKFGGYDISGDLEQFVYADEQGVKLFDTKDDGEKIIVKPITIAGYTIDNFNPKFIMDDHKVVTRMGEYGTDGTYGYNLCNLLEGTSKIIDVEDEDGTLFESYDSGVLISYLATNRETINLDYNTGTLKEIGNLSSAGIFHNFAVVVSQSNEIYSLSRFDLKSMKEYPLNVSIIGDYPFVIGVLKDGRIIFLINNGICITK